MRDDWRIRVEVSEEEHAETLLGRLGLDLGSDDAKRLAQELEGRRLAVSRDGQELFVYASSAQEAEQARQVVAAELADEGIEARTSEIEHWLHDEERWSNEAPQETWEEEARSLARRLHGEVEPGGELVWEVTPQNPFAVFGGLGGSGTPI